MIDKTFPLVWEDAINAICVVQRDHYWKYNDNGVHYWWVTLRAKFELHPVIERAVRDGYRPVDWQRMLLEWPHISTEDPAMIAYTRDEAAGRDFLVSGSKRQTRTSIGKYLSRHYPHIPDHTRRDWAGRYAPAVYEIWDTKEGIIAGVELGPVSCMKSSQQCIPFRESTDHVAMLAYRAGERESSAVRWERHPYICYAPEYGWAIAVRLDKGKPDVVVGRALVNKNAMQFVRSFKRNATEGGYSYSDEQLEAWLTEQGYCHDDAWNDGLRLKKVDHPDGSGFMAPYIDGGTQTVSDEGRYLAIDCDGPYTCDNTDGHADGDDRGEYIGDCMHCHNCVYEEDDGYYRLGREGDSGVLCSDHSHYASEVRGAVHRGGYTYYYVHDNNMVEIDGEQYDENNLPDCIVTDVDGDKRHKDCVTYCEDGEYREPDDCIEIDNAWYAKDSDDIVECRDEVWRKKTDCWEDDETGDWYPDDVDYIEVAGNYYHPDTVKQWLIDAGQMDLELEY